MLGLSCGTMIEVKFSTQAEKERVRMSYKSLWLELSDFRSGRAIKSPAILKWFVVQDIYPPDLPYLTGGVRGRWCFNWAARRVVGSGSSCITALLFSFD